MRIGIPRALLYYQYLALWKTFFQEMGCDVVLSSHTNKSILSGGTVRVVAETCLPVKAYCGHVMDLIGKCDYVFIPALKRTEKDMTNCSKFLGLPDMIKAVIPQCPPILEIDVDVNKGNLELYRQIYSLGRNFTWNPVKVKTAFVRAWQAHKDYIDLMRTKGFNMPQVLPEIERSCITPEQDKGDRRQKTEVRSQKIEDRTTSSKSISLALIGHPYMLYDDFINQCLREKLEKMGVALYTPEMVSQPDLENAVCKLVGKSYWGYEDELIGSGGHYLDNNQMDGVIAVVAFGCGPDSLMIDIVARYAREKAKKPFLHLVFDEHTGEAGILTRIEAFVDMIRRRKAALSAESVDTGLAS